MRRSECKLHERNKLAPVPSSGDVDPTDTRLLPVARTWIAGLRHKARHKFLSRRSLGYVQGGALFLQIGGLPRYWIKNLEIVSRPKSRIWLTMQTPAEACYRVSFAWVAASAEKPLSRRGETLLQKFRVTLKAHSDSLFPDTPSQHHVKRDHRNHRRLDFPS
jgi:hypothetical protein